MIASRAVAAGALALAALGVLAGCSDAPGEPGGDPASTSLVVSEPVAAPAPSGTVGHAALPTAATAASVSYVSLPPGSAPNATSAVVRNLATGASLDVRVAAGGFDPVGIAADVGDELAIEVRGAGGVLASLKVTVPRRRPPAVVRTSPPKGKTDVPLNSRIKVVFSEPVDPATVTAATVRLSVNGQPVAGSVQVDAGGLSAEFVPETPLAPGSTYELAVTTAVRDLAGDVLQEAVAIAFTTAGAASDARGPEHIYLANADGSAASRLTPGGWPSWSPDGRRIAFERDGDVYVINADGSNETRLAAGRSWMGPPYATPAWSPDGARIAFTSNEGISVMNADGSSVRTLIRHDFRDDTYEPWDMGVGKPAWSPDGARIAFEHLGDGDLQPPHVFVMNADGSDPRLLTELSGGADPSWSPDGSRLVCWTFGSGITVMDGKGVEQRSLFYAFPDVAYGAKPVWSPDGSTIAFNFHRYWTTGSAVWTVPATGGEVKILIPDGYDAAWSPNDPRIAFVRRIP